MAFIVIQHLSPDFKSMMVEILKRYTDLKIQLSASGQKVEEDTVYLIPPGKMLSIKNSTLNVFDIPAKSKLNFPVDHFFQSLADDQGKNAIGVILSGAGSDGSLGLRAIKSAGGLTVVQDTESASFEGMPQNAISTHMVDVVSPPERIPTILMQFCQLEPVQKHEF
jgi:two-component system CheB/CheR fusion protein